MGALSKYLVFFIDRLGIRTGGNLYGARLIQIVIHNFLSALMKGTSFNWAIVLIDCFHEYMWQTLTLIKLHLCSDYHVIIKTIRADIVGVKI